MQENNIERNSNRNLLIVGIICLVGIIGIVGYTYSYFQVEGRNTGTITGIVASASLSVEVEKLAPDVDKNLIPQLDTAIEAAVVGTQGNCIDDNHNAVCQVYEVTVKNTSSITINVDGLVELNAARNPNLKWTLIDSYSDGMQEKPNLIGKINPYSEKYITKNEEYAPDQEKKYYLVVWISETGYVQADTGAFTGTVTFRDTEPPALTTLTSLGLKDSYVGSAEDYAKIFNLTSESNCFYEGNSVISANPTEENCNTIYRANSQDGSAMYADGFSFSQMAVYKGKGAWDSGSSSCTYDGIPVFDMNQSPISTEANCGEVYDLEAYVGQTFYVSMLELLDEGGDWIEQDGIYSMEDDLGTSYFFRGDVDNNYVLFDNKYWRIIRFNGDGSVRMIYDGTTAHENGETSTDIYVTTKAFNAKYADNAFVGYMNGTTDGTNFPNGTTTSTSYAEAHTNTTDSTIKDYLENTWYPTISEANRKYIVDAIYCNDREVSTDADAYKEWFDETTVVGDGVGQNKTLYKAHERLTVNESNVTPVLTCSQTDDRFTLNSTSFDIETNGELEAPVGLITAGIKKSRKA